MTKRKTILFFNIILCILLLKPITAYAEDIATDIDRSLSKPYTVETSERIEIICDSADMIDVTLLAPDMTFDNRHVTYVGVKNVKGYDCLIYYLGLPGTWTVSVKGRYTSLAIITTLPSSAEEIPLPPKQIIHSDFTKDVLINLFTEEETVTDTTPTPIAFIPKVTDVPSEDSDSAPTDWSGLIMIAAIFGAVGGALFWFMNRNKKKANITLKQKELIEKRKAQIASVRDKENKELAELLRQTEDEYIDYPIEKDYSQVQPIIYEDEDEPSQTPAYIVPPASSSDTEISPDDKTTLLPDDKTETTVPTENVVNNYEDYIF